MAAPVSRKKIEKVIYFILWLIFFLLPVAALAIIGDGKPDWQKIYRYWLRILPFLVLFFLHDIFISPLLVEKKKYGLYCILALSVTLAVTLLTPVLLQMDAPPPGGDAPGREADLRAARPAPPVPFDSLDRHGFTFESIPAHSDRGGNNRPDYGKDRPGTGLEKPPRPAEKFQDPFFPDSAFLSFFIGILLIGFNIAVKFFFKSIDDEHKMKDLENSKLQNELDYLKVQLNPHFFMNTLNNIHALVDIDSEKAKTTIIEFSKLMRFMLYEADSPTISLDKEISFIINYVKLMKIRYADDVDISFDFPEITPNATIPPLLFVSFLENAFKYGVRYDDKSYVRITMSITDDIPDDRLIYEVVNSYWQPTALPGEIKPSGKEGGIGIPNSIKRLDLLFGDKYRLVYGVEGTEYRVRLSIPFSANNNSQKNNKIPL